MLFFAYFCINLYSEFMITLFRFGDECFHSMLLRIASESKTTKTKKKSTNKTFLHVDIISANISLNRIYPFICFAVSLARLNFAKMCIKCKRIVKKMVEDGFVCVEFFSFFFSFSVYLIIIFCSNYVSRSIIAHSSIVRCEIKH